MQELVFVSDSRKLPKLFPRLPILLNWVRDSRFSLCSHSFMTEETFLIWFYLTYHYYRLNTHCFQLWQFVYSEMPSTKTTMDQQYALSHNIKVFVLNMSVICIWVLLAAQISFHTPCWLLIRYNCRTDWCDLYQICMLIKMTSPNFPFVKIVSSNVFFIKGNLNAELNNP